MIRLVTATIIALAAVNAQAVGIAYGQGSTASQAVSGSGSISVATGNGYAFEATQTGASNSSGVHINATGGAVHNVDLLTYSNGGTYSFSQSAVGGSAFGITGGTASQGGFGSASGFAVDLEF